MSSDQQIVTLSGSAATAPTIEESHAALVAEGLLTEDGDGANTEVTIDPAEEAQEAAENAPTSIDKFKDADGNIDIEALQKSYLELEKKQSSGDPEGETADNEEDGEGEGDKLQPAKEVSDEERETVNDIADEAGVDLDQISQDFLSNGELAEEDYEKLAEAGYPREMVDTYARGLTSEVVDVATPAMEIAGGAEAYGDMIDWAIDNLSAAEAAAFDDAVDGGNKEAALQAVRGLNAQYKQATAGESSSDPEETIGGSSANSGSLYADQSEFMADLNDPRYETSEAFRSKVANKLNRSKI